ncbi:polysaccharide biosynthesis protein [Halobacteriales archaeon QS_4_69_34]|nr:MAG: polysaccharide biosynthesis protein [Halobacteriales archaeon QS_4_69_34]
MRNSITKLTSITFFGVLIGRGLRYGFNVVIARGLGLDALGLFAFGTVVMKGSAVIARMGLDSAAQKFIPIYQSESDPAKVTGVTVISLTFPLLFGGALAVALYLGRDLITRLTGAVIGSTVQLFLVGIPLFGAMMVGMNATRGFKETKYSVYIRDIGQSSVGIALIAIGAFVLSDFDAVIVGYLISLLVGVCLAVVFLSREGALQFDVRPTFEYRKILAFSLPVSLAASVQYLVSWTDILVLGVFVPPASIGSYQAAYQTSVLLIIVLQSVSSIFPAMAADLYNTGRHERLNIVYTVVTKWVTYLSVLGFALVAIYPDDILTLFGTSARSARIALVVLGLGQTLSAVVGPAGFLLIMSEHERLQMINSVAVALLNLVFNVVLVDLYGIVGAAAATGLSLGLINILRLAEVRYLLGVQPYSWGYWKGGVAVGSTLPLMVLGRSLPLFGPLRIVVVGTGALVVFAALIRLLGFDEVDRVLIEAID